MLRLLSRMGRRLALRSTSLFVAKHQHLPERLPQWYKLQFCLRLLGRRELRRQRQFRPSSSIGTARPGPLPPRPTPAPRRTTTSMPSAASRPPSAGPSATTITAPLIKPSSSDGTVPPGPLPPRPTPALRRTTTSTPSAASRLPSAGAVGNYSNGTTYQTLILLWNGSSWARVSSPDTSTTQFNELKGVTCPSASQCWAAGDYSNGTTYQTLIEQWNGSSWSIVSSPDASSAQSDYLLGVACSSASASLDRRRLQQRQR